MRVSAADGLGETESLSAIGALIDVLKPGVADRDLQRVTLQSLYKHYARNNGSRNIIDPHIDLVITAVKDGLADDNFGPAFHAVGILSLSPLPRAEEALVWAARSHVDKEIRSYAERSLPANR